MISFFSACADLFNGIFNEILQLPPLAFFVELQIGILLLLLWRLCFRGVRRL